MSFYSPWPGGKHCVHKLWLQAEVWTPLEEKHLCNYLSVSWRNVFFPQNFVWTREKANRQTTVIQTWGLGRNKTATSRKAMDCICWYIFSPNEISYEGKHQETSICHELDSVPVLKYFSDEIGSAIDHGDFVYCWWSLWPCGSSAWLSEAMFSEWVTHGGAKSCMGKRPFRAPETRMDVRVSKHENAFRVQETITCWSKKKPRNELKVY